MSVLSQKDVLLLMAVWGSSGCYNSRRTDLARFQPMREWCMCAGRDSRRDRNGALVTGSGW
jgi:hypothetical protein